MASQKSFTGRTRKRKTSPLVRIVDMLARAIITVGGIGTIIAVSTVCVFLVLVVMPLFRGATSKPAGAYPLSWSVADALKIGVDEYRVLGWALMRDGAVQAFDLRDGRPLETLAASERASPPAAVSLDRPSGSLVLGGADGSVRQGVIRFATSYHESDSVPAALRKLELGQGAPYRHGVIEKTPIGQFRLQELAVELEPLPGLKAPGPLAAVGHVWDDDELVVALLAESGTLDVARVARKTSLMTGETSWSVEKSLRYECRTPDGAVPRWVLVSSLGRDVFVAWEDGRCRRFNVRDVDEARAAEEFDLVPRAGARLTALGWLIGRNTLIAGDSDGAVRGWFARNDPGNPVDARSTLMAHAFEPDAPAAVTGITASQRSRIFAVAREDGTATLYFMTSEKHLATVRTGAGGASRLLIAPKDDELLVTSGRDVRRFAFEAGHPEVTFRGLFGKVAYEGHAEPAWTWQSSSGQEGYEKKLSLIPLIFGTIKATFYSMLLGVPIALLAAIFTSEFLHPKVRVRIKPTIELMASLPSVVLGFIAALVIAPLIKDSVPAVLVSFASVPASVVFGAYVWQILPRRFTLRVQRWRLLFILPFLVLGVALAMLLGPVAESCMFGTDIKVWLHDPRVGTPTGAWMLLLLPLFALVLVVVYARWLGPRLQPRVRAWTRRGQGLFDLTKFFALLLLCLMGAWGGARLLGAIGLDPRWPWVLGGVDLSPMGTYIQRNALIVGFVMGFAVIPIIYTIAEDALSAVPDHLRSASLGAGATPWQTAARICIPTAMSGLFSALMVGLGRAVGETMIVLMAAGNTPIMELNIFNGFRTLSANIATELPEAVRNSTHYRTLFLAALALFIMTFFINTVAELVRRRFRQKTVEL
jgi:phosphate transport system permease protein